MLKCKGKIAEVFDASSTLDELKPGQFYCYVQYRPNGKPFNVGKGNADRWASSANRNKYWHNVVNKYGNGNIKTVIFPCNSEDEAFAWEAELIEKLIGSKKQLKLIK